jgi:hypothetical protein
MPSSEARIISRLVPTYVQREVLDNIPDVFDADAIWQAPGLALFSRRTLLRDLLERAPREQRGRAATRCFSHITLALPQDEVDDDRHLTRGARVRDLTQGLAALHQKDFGDLLQGDEVRYRVVGAEGLSPGEIEVRFGHAVYLPAPGETIQYTVSVSRDSAVWKTVCPIYPNQRLTLVGHDANNATHAAPGWPFGGEGAILLVNDGPGTPLEVQVRPKEALECTYDPTQDYYIVRSRRGGVDGSGAPLRLLLRVTPAAVQPQVQRAQQQQQPRPMTLVPQGPGPGPAPATATAAAVAPGDAAAVAPPAARPAVWKPRLAAPADMTALPAARAACAASAPLSAETEATYAPVARQRVALAALALPRLSRYRDTGARTLEIGLNRALVPASGGTDADSVIRFAVDEGDTLHAITAAGREAIAVPASFRPLDNTAVDLLAPAPQMADRYCALLRLPQAPALPVAPGVRQVFGRSTPVLAALRVLDSPRFLRHAPGSGSTADADFSADRLGLSRSAFSFEPGADGYRIARLSPTQALYHLDEQLGFVAAIGDATPEAPYTLPAGHHLVAGHYVLRFDA